MARKLGLSLAGAKPMKKLLSRLFWAFVALVLVVGAYEAFYDTGEPKARVDSVNLEAYSPRCVNARNEPVEFEPRQHKVFAERSLTGLTAAQDEKTILFDYDELAKTPPEYRDFVLRAACARNANVDAQAADCTAIKRLRDEKGFSKEKVTLIAQRLTASPSTADDKEARTQNLYACFDAPR
jgi:hypothetical protein